MSGWLSGPRDSRPLGHSAIDGGGDPFSGARVVSVAHFEPAAGMQGEALDSYKRRFGTLFIDESTRRRGGIGSVVRATNVLGEQFALKTLVIPERDERASEAEYERYEAGLKTAFRQEFECHKAVSGLKGFPHLYGMGEVAGTPPSLWNGCAAKRSCMYATPLRLTGLAACLRLWLLKSAATCLICSRTLISLKVALSIATSRSPM